MKYAAEPDRARPETTDGALATELTNLGLSVLAVAVAAGVFLLFGAIAISFLTLAAVGFGLFLWRRRRPYLAGSGLALLAGILLLTGGGPSVGGFGLGPLLGALAILVLAFPLVRILTGP